MLDRPELIDFFEPERLAEAGRRLHDEWRRAEPFPHVALDGFLPETIVREVAASVPRPDAGWVRRQRDAAIKWGFPDEHRMPLPARVLIHELQSAAFLGFLEELSGIRGLVPDPYLVGGGIHQIERGGFLKIHADFNLHDRTKLHRRLNLLLFLNDDWQDAWGGHLELWDRDMTRCVQRYAPSLNRMVVFRITDDALHGHPHPLTTPDDVTRKSIALYYYTAERPAEELSKPHGVLYHTLPGEAPLTNPLRAEPLAAKDAAPAEPPRGWRGRLHHLRRALLG